MSTLVFVAAEGGVFATDYYLKNKKVKIGAIVVDGKGIDNSFMVPSFIDPENYSTLNCENILTTS